MRHLSNRTLVRRSSNRWLIPTFLALQVGLLWLQGAQLHQQNRVLQELREELHTLADAIDNGQAPASTDDEGSVVPASFLTEEPRKTAVLGAQEEEQAPARELQASRDSAQKAVKDAREAQSKLSIEENYRKAEETKKVQAATQTWQRWAPAASAVVILALLGRAFLRRRG